MVAIMEPRTEAKTAMRVQVRCAQYVKGRTCNHVIATILVDEWEQQRALNTTVECKRCGNVEMLSRFM